MARSRVERRRHLDLPLRVERLEEDVDSVDVAVVEAKTKADEKVQELWTQIESLKAENRKLLLAVLGATLAFAGTCAGLLVAVGGK